MNKLSKKDYEYVLKYYNLSVPSSLAETKKRAENILAEKLCTCIKKVSEKVANKDESRSIAICTSNIFEKKNIKRGAFTCKNGKRRVSLSKRKSRRNRK